jgi:hypothetical protein
MPTAALAFSPLGLSKSFTAAAAAPTSVQGVPTDATRGAYQYRVVNSGDQLVLLGVGATDAAAKTAAASLAAGAIPLVPGAVEVLSFPANSYFSGTTASGTSVVYVTPGEGL